MEDAFGPRNKGLHYMDAVKKIYGGLRKLGLDVDFLDMEESLEGYDMIFAPMLYMFRAGIEDKIRSYVADGGTFVMTYWSGIVNDTDLCYLGGTPHALTDVFGLRSTELDALYDGDENEGIPTQKEFWQEQGYQCSNFCDLIKTSTAEALLQYSSDFYEGYPALTRNAFGSGKAYYVCADFEQRFYDDFCRKLVKEAGIELLCEKIEEGLSVTTREDEDNRYVFVQNFCDKAVPFKLTSPDYQVLSGNYDGMIGSYETVVFTAKK